MSMIALGWAWKQNLKLPSQKLLLVALADQARECGHVWPSVKTLGVRVGVQDRQSRKLLSDLVDVHKLVERIEQFRSDGSQSVNLYRLKLTDPSVCASECRGSFDYQFDDARPVHPVPQTREGLSRCAGASYEPKEEPKKKAIKKREKKNSKPWAGPLIRLAWAEGLHGLSLVDGDHPSEEWLDNVQGSRADDHMKIEVAGFVDYYNAPKTRKLKEWKTSFRTWINRSVEQFDSSGVLHDTSLPRGECKCGMCLKRAGK